MKHFKILSLSYLLGSILALHSVFCFSQNNNEFDSLNNELAKAPTDSQKVNTLCKIATYYWDSNPDSSIYIATRALRIAEKIENKKLKAFCYHVIAGAYDTKGNYPISIEYNLKAIQLREEIGDKKGLSRSLNNLGLIFSYQKNYEQALEYYNKALDIKKELKDSLGIAYSYINEGLIYSDMKKVPLAMEFFKNSLVIAQRFSDEYLISYNLLCIADLFILENKYDSAFLYAQKSIIPAQRINNKELIAKSYNISAIAYKQTGKTELSIKNAMLALEAANEIKSLKYIKQSGLTLYECYQKKNNYQKALYYYKIAVAANDSMFNSQKNIAISTLRYDYDILQKQKQIQTLTKDKKYAQHISLLFSIAFVLLAFMAYFTFKSFRRVKKNNTLLEQQKSHIKGSNDILILLNKELLQKNEEVSSQRDEIEAQRDAIEIQKEIIELKNLNITDSIVYASRIQNAILPSTETLSENLSDYFILFKPVDIVSGDFYWFKQIKNFIYFAAADCTGHGVPGAFMSMLGVSLLNEIVSKRDVNPPHMILNDLRKRVKKSLNQHSLIGEAQDGMDIAFCVIDLEDYTMQYAGAYNPLYIIRNQTNIPELIELKADRMPIGVHPNDKQEFTNKEIQLLPNDSVYIFSDGYSSQFGGENSNKFKTGRFKDLLLSIQDKSMEDQKRILDKTLRTWQGINDQVDDILVMGIRIQYQK